jgi:hypothetical protein
MPVWIVGSDVAGGGGGGAATIADGADVTQGAKIDAAWDGSAASPTVVAILKSLYAKIEAVRAVSATLTTPVAIKMFSKTDASITAGTPVTIWTPAAGKKFRLYGYHVSQGTSTQILFKDGGTEFFRTEKISANAAMSQSFRPDYYESTAANNVLALDVVATANVGGYVWGVEV